MSVPRKKRPPRPIVEDEEESLAKEHTDSVVSDSTEATDEEPKHRGEVDQLPIILPVHEYNPERRFVIVPGAETETGKEETVEKERYDANTCRKYVIVSPEGASSKEDRSSQRTAKDDRVPREEKKLPHLPKRKSHQDLPRLDTHVDEHEQAPIRRSNSRHSREKAVVDQDQGHHSREGSRSSRPPRDDELFLSPSVKYTNGGRDREYRTYDTGRPSRSPSTRGEPRIETSGGRQGKQYGPDYPPISAVHKRASSTASAGGPNRERQPQERPRSFVYPGDPTNNNYLPDDIMSFMAPDVDFSPSKQRQDVSPPRGSRTSNSPPYYPRKAGKGMPDPLQYKHQPHSRTRGQDGYGSDDDYMERRDGGSYPARAPTESEYPPTLPPEDGRRKDPAPPINTSPSRINADVRRGIPSGLHSQDGSRSGSLDPPLSSSLGRSSTLEKRPQSRSAAVLSREDSSDPSSPVPYWQPDESTRSERRNSITAVTPVTSLRRYSEDVAKGLFPELPDCRWKTPTHPRNISGNEQFMTLKAAENFSICPDCYKEVFAKSEFQHLFVPALVRGKGQLISCDFGSSIWYRIAYILTLKSNYPDLRLMLGVASVAARHQPCGGSEPATRIWYSMGTDSRRTISTFQVCLSCARMVEALLPNLAGVFVPVDSHEPTWGICDLYYTPDRKRFIDYFDLMETISDQAVKKRMAPDILELADRVRNVSLLDECWRSTPIPNRRWYVMDAIPEFTVCEECFDAVVWPLLEDEEIGAIPRNFFRSRQTRKLASCQLYSERMRNVFHVACQHDDFGFLEKQVWKRIQTLEEIKQRHYQLQQADPNDPEVQRELAELAKQKTAIA